MYQSKHYGRQKEDENDGNGGKDICECIEQEEIS